MGVLNQKLKKQLQSIGVSTIPTHFKRVEQRIYQSFQTSTRLTSHSILLQKGEIEAFLSSVILRKKNPNCLIQIQYAQVKKEEMQYCKILLFLETIALNLQSIMLLNFRDMIGMLYFSLQGFQQLLRHYGKYFTLQSYMIAITDKGQLKVWFNKDFTKYQPKSCYLYSKSGNKQEAEHNMVKELKKLFLCKVQKSSIPQNFTLDALKFKDLTCQIQKKFGNELFVNNFQKLILLKESQSGRLNKYISQDIYNIKGSQDVQNVQEKRAFIKFNYASNDTNTKTKAIVNFKYSNLSQTKKEQNGSVY